MSRIDLEDFKNVIKVDRFNLHVDCEIQAVAVDYWNDKQSDIKKEKEYAEIELDVLLSSKELEYRENPPEKMKVTDAAIKALVVVDLDVIKQKKKVIELKFKLNDLDNKRNALEHRKSMLKNLVSLYGFGYYSLPEGKNTNTDQIKEEMMAEKKRRKENK